MKLYWRPQTRALRVLWMLEESGLPFELVHINIRDAAQHDDPAFRAVSPLGKVPALSDGDLALWDSGAICGYVADLCPDRNLAPSVGDPRRGLYYQWLGFTNGYLEPAMVEKMGNAPVNTVSHGWSSYDAMLGLLRAQLQAGPWLLGEQFTAADVLVGTGVHYLRLFNMLGDDEPLLSAYADRCLARPAFQRAAARENS